MDDAIWQECSEDILESLSNAVLILDAAGTLVYANPAAEETLGLPRGDIVGLHYSRLPWHPLDGSGRRMSIDDRPVTRILSGSQESFRQLRAEIEYHDGARGTVLLDGSPLKEADGTLKGVVVAFSDVTARETAERELRSSEQALRRSEERYRQLFANMNEGVALHEVVYDESGTAVDYIVRDVNAVFEEIVGVSREEAAGREASELYGTGHAPYLDEYAGVAATGVPVSFETYFPPLDRHFIVSAFSPSRGEFATVFTDITQRKRLEAAMQSRASRLEGLYRTAALAGASLDAEDIARSFVANAIGRLGLAVAVIMAVDPDGRTLTPVAHRGLPVGFWDRVPVPIAGGEDVTAEVWGTGEPIGIGDLDASDVSDRVRSAARLAPELRAVIAAPMKARDEIVGVAYFGWAQPREFGDDDLEYFTSMSNALAVGMMNARLYAAEHHIAQTLQEALLVVPDRLPGLAIDDMYRSATEAATVGGDFYDVFQIEHGRAGVIIGDVAGKGVSAAALTVLVKSIVKTSAYKGLSPAQVMAEANESIMRGSADNMFATVFFGILDTVTGQLTYCSAGHPAALVKRRDGCVDELEGGSPLVGAFAGVRFTDQCVSLHRGDTLVLYTDGVLEARDGSEMFGEQRLRDAVGRADSDIPARVLAEVRAFTGGALADDTAILAVRYVGRPEEPVAGR